MAEAARHFVLSLFIVLVPAIGVAQTSRAERVHLAPSPSVLFQPGATAISAPLQGKAGSEDYRVEGAVLLGITGLVLGAALGGYGDADNGNRPALILVAGGGAAIGGLLGYFIGMGIHKPTD